ncbi:hypothetical protein [Ruicaihuangia caeni]|uniref:DUF3618 domain-containing protein n=1 Tax=Ruicaihuangia caeni TaxID=3042517 RepID=A0AAW6T538_9MICO|nr:hypothetical protein [Klugiella sp. YN-L-19]MDI2098946.1 hypothetical protein [Klugiella sp. YN-L-19]
MTDTAKEQAKHVGHEAAEATSHVAHTAKDEAAGVASEASAQAKSLFAESRQELTDQAEKQQRRVAEGLRSLSGELDTMAQHSESDSTAGRLVSQMASKADDVAAWLDQRDPGSLVDEVKGFARQHPGAFIAMAAGAGLLVGRLTRSLVSGDEGSSSSRTSGMGRDDTRTMPASQVFPPTGAGERGPSPADPLRSGMGTTATGMGTGMGTGSGMGTTGATGTDPMRRDEGMPGASGEVAP